MQIYDGSKDKKALPTKHTVSVISANRIVTTKDWMTIRKNGREDWSLFYCESGQLLFDDQILHEGQIWLYPPKTPHKYIGYSKNRVIYHYLHFTGSDLEQLLQDLAIPTHAPLSVDSKWVINTMQAITQALTADSPLNKLVAEYNVLYLLSRIANAKKQNCYTNTIARVVDEMEHNFAAKYDAGRYAKLLNLSESRFNHIFKAEVGISPYCYLLQLRINNAATLLEQTNLQIKQIAEQSGFEDPLHFTQAFKKATGVTPSIYRKQTSMINQEA